MTKVFIDGSVGTTGLRIFERLEGRKDIELLKISEELRKDTSARKEMLNNCDIAFLCLPDAAAIEAVSLIDNKNAAVIDTSTAHRVKDGWAYGFPELSGRRELIKNSKRIANPGCHASGFIALIEPLVKCGVIKSDAKLCCTSLTGYSGGGKKMIAEYEEDGRDVLLDSPRMYGLNQSHKHLPEMRKICALENMPVFMPIVSDFYSGMQVTVPLFKEDIGCGIDKIKEIYKDYYKDGIVSFAEIEDAFMASNHLSGRDDMTVSVVGNDDRIVLVSRFDNLGKGASGAAIQNMNILLGVDEKTGLNV